MNNKGFTLVELLAVIVILAMIVLLAVPAALNISKSIRDDMYCSKVDLLENAALLYGQDNYDEIRSGRIVRVSIQTLLDEDYLKKDELKTFTDSDGKTVESAVILDPRDNKEMNNLEFELSIQNKRVKAVFEAADYNTLCKDK